MREIRVIAVNYDWDKNYPVDDISILSVGEIKTWIQMENDVFKTQNVMLMYQGCVIPSDDVRILDIVSE